VRTGGVDGFPLTVELGGDTFDGFRLELTKPGRIQFNEFEAWSGSSDDSTNVALRQTVRQSSSPKKGHGPRGGNSGRVHADIGAITDFEDEPWWEVDLDGAHPISHIHFFNRISHNASSMDALHVLGRVNGEWTSLYDHRSDNDVANAFRRRLQNDRQRIESQLAHAITPRLSRIGTTDTEIGREVLAGWHESSELGVVADLASSFAEVLATHGTDVPAPVVALLRNAAKLAMPTTLVSRVPHTQIIATNHVERLSLHTFNGVDDSPVKAIRSCDAMLDLAYPESSASMCVDHWTPRLQQVDQWDTPDDTYFVDLDGSNCRHAKWELWGHQSDGTQVLVYDSLALSSSVLALLQVVSRLGLQDFETLDALLAGLELEGRTVCAIAASRWVEVEDPGLPRFERSLQEIELRSSIDEGRKPATRTKHGYKTTHRFMDPAAYAKGTKRLLDVVAKHPDFSHCFAAFGTLLGFIREGGFIPHDDDADLVVVTAAQSKAEMMELRDTLRAHLAEKTKFELFDGSKLPGKNLPVGFSEGEQWVHIDLFLTFYEDGQLMIFNDRTKSFDPIDGDLLALGRKVTIHGVKFDVPQRSEELLELWYGPNWAVPMTSYLLGYSWQRK